MAAYGHAALEELRKAVREAKQGDPLAPVTVLMPNNMAGMVARRFLAQGLGDGNHGVAAIFPTTIVRLAEQLAAPALHPRRPATAPVVAASWRAALGKAPGIFADVAEHPATVEALVRAGRELRDLDDQALDAVAAATTLGPDLVRLYREVRDGLAPGWYDEVDLLHAATTVAERQPNRIAEFGAVVLYLPQLLTQAEAAFVRTLAGTGGLRVVAGLTGEAKADAAVRRSLERIGVDAPPEPRKPTATRVLTASDADDEVRCVVREVVRSLRTAKAHRVAVLYASRDPYARLLHEHLGAAGITVNGPGTRPVLERAVARAVLELLDLAADEVPRADLFRILSAAPMRTRDGERIPVARWERLSRAAGVVQGNDWDARLRHHVADLEVRLAKADSAGRVERLTRDIEECERLRAFAAGLRDDLHRGQQMVSWGELSEWALDLVHSLVGEAEELTELPLEEQYAAAAVEHALRAVSTLDGVGAPAGLPALRETLTSQLDTALPRVGRFGDGVLVAPVTAAIGLDADVVFVLGLAEGVFPARLREDPLLPERARDASGGQLLGYRERIDTSHRALLAAFAAAPEVVASFPRGDLRTKSRHLPSRWLLPTLRVLSGRENLSATEWDAPPLDWLDTSPSYAGSLTSTRDPACEQEWRTQAATAGLDLGDEVVDAATRMERDRGSDRFTRFDGDLTGAADGLPDYAAGTRAVSPTALEKFAGCPHGYFIERVLGVQPVEQPEDIITISPADIGTLMHAAFDAMVHEFADRLPGFGEPWSDEQRRRLGELAEEKAAELAEQGRTGHPRLWQQAFVRIQADLQAMLRADDAWRREHRARVLTSELTFGMDGADPVAVPLPDGGTLLMRGAADKVDETEDGRLVVTDLKSGSTTSFKGLGEDDPVLGGRKLQLPVYAHAARQAYGRPDAEVEAAYWFVRRDNERIAVPLTPEVERTYAETLQIIVTSIREGLFPARPPVKDDYAFVQCGYCNPDGIGYGSGRDRWARKRNDLRLRALVTLTDPQPTDDIDGADA